jgi:hypothetical protein
MKITLTELRKVVKKLILELKEFDMDLSNLPNSVKLINDAYMGSDKKIYVVVEQ